ncbi:MAG: GTPase Era [Pseudomonadota bacterium]
MTDTDQNPTHRCGYVALIGRPNVGKSTLLNALLGQKLSITAHKPQTTRHQILGVSHHDDGQLVFVDTPGLHAAPAGASAMNRYLNRVAEAVSQGVDVVAWLLDARGVTDADLKIGEGLRQRQGKLFCVLNKTDLVTDKAKLLPLSAELAERFDPDELLMISAQKGKGLEELRMRLLAAVPEGPPVFGEDELTDRSERFIATEFIREQVTRRLHQELPYASTVEVEAFQREGPVLHIAAVIWVEREGQKGIVIGQRGATLKGIGTAARATLEGFFACRVNLKLWVKVKKGWSDDERSLQQLGYVD